MPVARAALAACAAAMLIGGSRVPPNPIATDGWAGLRLAQTPAETLRVAGDGALMLPGCDGREHVMVADRLDGLPVTVAALFELGRVAEIELTVDAPKSTPDRGTCLALRDKAAAPFLRRFGAADSVAVHAIATAEDHALRLGPVRVAARWFPSGGSCYVSAVWRSDR